MFGLLRRLIGRRPVDGKKVEIHVEWMSSTTCVLAKTDTSGNPVTIGPKWVGSTFHAVRPSFLPISCWGSAWPSHRITKVRAAQRELEFDPATVKCEQRAEKIVVLLPSVNP